MQPVKMKDGTRNKRSTYVWLGPEDNHAYQTHVTHTFQKMGGVGEAREGQAIAGSLR